MWFGPREDAGGGLLSGVFNVPFLVQVTVASVADGFELSTDSAKSEAKQYMLKPASHEEAIFEKAPRTALGTPLLVGQTLWSDPAVEVGPKHGPSMPEGLRYIRDFVTCSEEEELVAITEQGDWLSHLIRAQQFFGLVYYQTRHDMASLQPASLEMQQGRPLSDLPSWLLPRLIGTGVFVPGELNQVAVNRYTGTTGIAAHVEDPHSFGPNLATLSLLQPVQMTLSVASEAKNSKELPGDGIDHGNWVKVLLEPRSLLVLQGESRYAYRHGIRRSRLVRLRDGTELKRAADYCRISLTFRQLLETRRMVQVSHLSPTETEDVQEKETAAQHSAHQCSYKTDQQPMAPADMIGSNLRAWPLQRSVAC